jgi:class 3 adenylate cyclase
VAESTAPATYRVTRDGDGSLQQIMRESDGARITLDENDQGFCDFLTWASHLDPIGNVAPFAVKPGASYFAEKNCLVNHCKRHGFMIYTVREPLRDNHLIQRGETHDGGTRPLAFCALLRAAAPPHGLGPIDGGGINRIPSLTFITEELLAALQCDLGKEEDAIRRLSAWPIHRSFVYIDISDFSRYQPGQEALIIHALAGIVGDQRFWTSPFVADAWDAIEAWMCIGDGYIFVLKDAILATCFAAYLAQLIEELVARKLTPVEFHFRMGIHCGPVYCFWDPGREDWNFIGEGINGGQRVLAAIGKETDDVLFVSQQVRHEITAQSDHTARHGSVLACLENRGRRADKHGNLWRVYEVNHTQLTSAAMSPLIRSLAREQERAWHQ